MVRQEDSLYSNMSQCLEALHRVQTAYVMAHPLIKADLQMMHDRLSSCISTCASQDMPPSSFYRWCFSALSDLQATYHSRLTKYFNQSPFWLHYMDNMEGTIKVLAQSCQRLTAKELDENGNEMEIEFSRKFLSVAEVMRRKWSGLEGRRMWIENTFRLVDAA